MIARDVVVRETVISVVANMIMSALFFVLVFGRHGPVSLAATGPDLIPQTFMVTLMGSIVPGWLTARRQQTGRYGAVVVRSFLAALAAAIIIGGGGWLLLDSSTEAIPYGVAVAARVALGGVLSIVVTPSAVRHAARVPA